MPWLVTNRKEKKAEEILQEAGKFNKISIPEKLFTRTNAKNTIKESQVDQEVRSGCMNVKMCSRDYLQSLWDRWRNYGKDSTKDKYDYGPLVLARSPALRMYALSMMFIW